MGKPNSNFQLPELLVLDVRKLSPTVLSDQREVPLIVVVEKRVAFAVVPLEFGWSLVLPLMPPGGQLKHAKQKLTHLICINHQEHQWLLLCQPKNRLTSPALKVPRSSLPLPSLPQSTCLPELASHLSVENPLVCSLKHS